MYVCMWVIYAHTTELLKFAYAKGDKWRVLVLYRPRNKQRDNYAIIVNPLKPELPHSTNCLRAESKLNLRTLLCTRPCPKKTYQFPKQTLEI